MAKKSEKAVEKRKQNNVFTEQAFELYYKILQNVRKNKLFPFMKTNKKGKQYGNG
jgi:hypothetical protein